MLPPSKATPNLRSVLALANTGWTTGNVENVLQKLQKIGIRDVSGLAFSLRIEAGRGLNAQLRNAGEKGFARATLEALQQQLVELFPETAPPPPVARGPDVKDAAAAKAGDEQGDVQDSEVADAPLEEWIVVYDRVVKRSKPSVDAEAKGVVKKGRTVHGVMVDESGTEWLRVPDREPNGAAISVYMLISGESLGLGPLLERLPPKDNEVALRRSPAQPPLAVLAAVGAGAELPWTLGIRAGSAVFLVAHGGLRLDVEGGPEGKPDLSATWTDQKHDLVMPVSQQDVMKLVLQSPAGERNVLRARFDHSRSWQKFIIEKRNNSGQIFAGDRIFLRAHTGRLLIPQGDQIRAESAAIGDFLGWTIERADGQVGELWHGQAIRLRAPGGELLCVQGGCAGLQQAGSGEECILQIDKDLRSADVPDWEVPAPSGWWRVTHRPSIYVHDGPNRFCKLVAAYITDMVLAVDLHWLSPDGELWLRLRDERRDGVEQWARTTAKDEGFDMDLMELLPTHGGAPSDEARLRHYSAVEAVHRARDQGRRAVERGDRPASLTFANCTEDMLVDVYAAEHASTVDRSLGHPTAKYSSQAAMAAVGDFSASGSFARRLLREGFAISDTVISRREAIELAAEAERLDKAGLLHEPDQPTPGQRGDRIIWLSETGTKHHGSRSHSPALGAAIDLLKGVADALNPALSRHHAERKAGGDPAHAAPLAPPATDDAVLTVAPRAMLTCYPGSGTRYIAHQDNMYRRTVGRRGNPRELTAILYLQPMDWDAKQDGGELKLYLRSEQFVESPEEKGLREVSYVAPLGGRLVVFFSALWHEVLPAYRERRALTLWIYRPSVE